jgi:hypothetical protein
MGSGPVINYDQAFTPNVLLGVNFKWNLDNNVWLNFGVSKIYNPGYYYRAVQVEGAGSADTTVVKGSSRGVLVYAGVSERYGSGWVKLVPTINWEIFSATENASIITDYYSGTITYNTFGLGLNPSLGVEFDWKRFSIIPQTGVNLLFVQSAYSYRFNYNGDNLLLGSTIRAKLRLTWDVISQIAVNYRF